MNRIALLVVTITMASCLITGINVSNSGGRFAAAFTTSASAQSSACAFPTSPAATPEQTAWQIFVAANCPGTAGQVVWEGWLEQLKVYPACLTCGATIAASQVPKRLHGSPLARAMEMRQHHLTTMLAPNSECGTMHGPPHNVVNTIICEEARLNPEAVSFLTGANYQLRPAQTAAAQQQTDIEFPTPSIEVKVDWIPGTDFNPPFTCSNPPPGVHVEMIDGTCYAMAGMHISSKLLKNWLWATFEPQSMQTNPLRCITFGSCSDSWGSNPATSGGGATGFTQLTPALQTLMTQANLAPEFLNYRLDGVQTDFTTASGQPTYLGNSIIEGENVGMTNNTASCITCHSESSIKSDGTDNFSSFAFSVGPQYQIPPNWIARDFVWSMALACPDPTGTGFQSCQ